MIPLSPLTLLLMVLAICFTVMDSITGVAIVGGIAVAFELFRAYVDATTPAPPEPAPRVEDDFA